MLCPAADALTSIALNRSKVAAAVLPIDVRLVVKVGLDVARVEGGSGVGEAWNGQSLFGTVGNELVAFVVAQPEWIVGLWTIKRPLFDDEHRLAGVNKRVRYRRAARSAADDDNVKAVRLIRHRNVGITRGIRDCGQAAFRERGSSRKRSSAIRPRVARR